jgi:hypothetical protein
MQKLLGTALLSLAFSYLHAQEFGGNPPSVKWKQINTDTAKVIFPNGLDSTAQRVASIIHFLAAKNNSLGKRMDKINIVLQNQTTIANGYVGLGPYRSEFFLTPSFNNFDLGSIPWADGLALHEYRHVQQFSNFRVGLSKALYYLAGEDGLTVAINAAIPDWFYEGDAVYNETVHSQQGRGRIPLFTNQYRSLWLDKKNYSWMKLRNGSLKDYVPNHYALGYLLVNYGYEKYGKDFWGKVTTDAAAYRNLFYPFQGAIARNAGVEYKTFRKQAFDYYKNQDSEKLTGSYTFTEPLTKEKKQFVTDHHFPYQLSDNSIVYLKSTYRNRPAFVVKENGKERRIRVKDISLDEHYGYNNGKIVYASYKPDVRWGWRDYSEIKILDVATGNQKKLTSKTKYFTPDISPDGSKVAAVYTNELGKSEIHILNSTTGQIEKKISSSEIGVFNGPKFVNENLLVTNVRLPDGRMALATALINEGITERLTPLSYSVTGFLNVSDGYVYYTASYNGNDEIYAVRLSDKKIYSISKSFLGNYYPNVVDRSLVFSTFTADGYQLQKTKIDTTLWQEVDQASIESVVPGFTVSNTNLFNDTQLGNVPQRSFGVNKYSKGTKLLNFHSWRPYYEDPQFTYTIYGQNVLNTLQTELYYLYNQDEKTNAVGLNTTFGGLLPFISAGTEYTFKRTDTLNNLTREWSQLDTRVGLNFPLNFSGRRFFRNLNFGSNYVFRIENNTGPTKDLFVENNFSYLSHFFNFSQQVQMARQHIFPKLGYNFTVQYRHAITKYDSHQFFGSANIYLPGFLSTHSIVLNGSIQERDTTRALFSDRFADARGYLSLYYTNAGSRMWRLSGNYHLPLLLPDWGFGNILYLQRIRANLFYDFQKVFSNSKKTSLDLRSTGVEFYVDTKWWNQYPLTFGCRISTLLDRDPLTRSKGTYFEFILPVSIIPR